VSERDSRFSITRRAPAKLNLTLAVLGRREDGYHALHSVMAPLAFGDDLTVQPGRGTADTLTIDGGDLPAMPDNLVLRAIAAARAEAIGSGVVLAAQSLEATLAKRIPVAAGLGGGSSDAAAAIGAALEAWHATLASDRLTAVAASVGSDVPFFLARGMALVTGRGEFVEPLSSPPDGPSAVLLVTPRIAVSTAAVFAAYAAGARPAEQGRALATSDALAAALRRRTATADLVARAADLAAANDLLPGARAVAPELARFHDALAGILGCPVGQSGSGPSLWALYGSAREAEAAAAIVGRALAAGRLTAPGSGEPFVCATTIPAGFPGQERRSP
jgi:4-diphosphocytidyl-2-C-methyl-D-erythritol kinase